MADKFTPPSIDWTSSGDVHKRFKLFRQKYEFIFEGPLEKVEEKKQVRYCCRKQQVPYTALWMYRVTPLDNYLPSPYELLYGHKPKTLIPSSKKDLQSRHPDIEIHQEKNCERQQIQADTYDRKAVIDKRILNNMEPVYVRNTIKKV